ncbi:kinase-like protein, partial [Melanomma pulvis-pyrius CBS 109.77]
MTSRAKPYLTSRVVKRDYVRAQRIGSGTDGYVDLYTQRLRPTKSIVVKYPKGSKAMLKFSQRNLVQELEAMKIFRPYEQENIVQLLGWDDACTPSAPALFYEYCALGDLVQYRNSLTAAFGRVVPEETLWKFFADIAKGLQFLSTAFVHPVVHGDIKPANCLVAMPPGCTDKVPTLPIFKLADFSRATVSKPGEAVPFCGTWAYAPPMCERAMVTPAADVYGLGATLQAFAYGAAPTELKPDFIRRLRACGCKEKDLPTDEDLATSEAWKSQLPVIYRPLNAKPDEQVKWWGVLEKNVIATQYDFDLNCWYAGCLDYDARTRLSAQDLACCLVPIAARKI